MRLDFAQGAKGKGRQGVEGGREQKEKESGCLKHLHCKEFDLNVNKKAWDLPLIQFIVAPYEAMHSWNY